MAAGFRGLLELTGVWPAAPPAPPVIIQAGFIGFHQLSGVWITGAPAYVLPPVPSPTYGGGGHYIYDEIIDPLREQILREDEEIIIAVIALIQSGVIP